MYSETGCGLSYFSCCKLLTELKNKEDYAWLKDIDSLALQSSLKNLADAYSRFFSHQNGHPNFKSKNKSKQSYTTKNVGGNVAIKKKSIKLPKLGMVKLAKSRNIKGRILSATISMNPTGKFYVSILCEEEILPLTKTNSSIGIDLGLENFAILSDGTKHDNLRFSKQLTNKLKKEQRKLSRRREIAKKQGRKLSECKNYQTVNYVNLTPPDI